MALTLEEIETRFEGIYDVPEAARILAAAQEAANLYPVSSAKLIRWIRQGVADADLAETPGRDLLIAFEDLVSLRVIAALRAANVSFPRIRAAEAYLREMTRHPRPFATESLWTDTSRVFAELRSNLIAASEHGQVAMRLLQQRLIPVHGLTFRSGIASSWSPADFIRMRTEVQFGAPCIDGARIPASSVWSAWRGGDSKQFISASYGVSLDEVEAAIAWQEKIAA